MNQLEYPRERVLSALTLAVGLLFWLLIVVGTVGGALIGLLFGFVIYLFAHSASIAWIKGNGVELSERQFPDLHAQFVACCDRLEIEQRPSAWVLNGGGTMNAFATRFLGQEHVVLLSGVVDAMKTHPDGAAFYIGHELGHLRMKHLTRHFLRWPSLWLPLLGAAYSRAKESTCDRHGLACSSSPENAALALSALASGGERWKTLDVPAFRDQARETSGFWMSFHELCSGYPWLTKRVVRVSRGDDVVPSRHPLAFIPALFVPYAGRLGGGFGVVILIYVVGVLAAVALPAYNTYATKAKVAQAIALSQPTRVALEQYYAEHHQPPGSLADVNAPELQSDGSQLSLSPTDMVLTVETKKGALVFTPHVDPRGGLAWSCAHQAPMQVKDVPAQCAQESP